MNEIEKFEHAKKLAIQEMASDKGFQSLTAHWFVESCKHRYSYNFSWMGHPIIQYPQDIMAMQEIIWRVKPDLIIETGIAHGGSIIFYAAMVELLGGDGEVCGIDIEIRPHNRIGIENHPMFKRITMLEGSSTDEDILNRVAKRARNKKRIMVVLDSNHTHDHVMEELQLYAPLVTKGSYLVVFDTVVEDMSENLFPDRPWGRGNNPRTAVQAFLETTDRFEVDHQIESKLAITVAPGGYLKCVKG